MNPEPDDEAAFAHRLTIFSTSGAMVGVCLTGIGLIGVISHLKTVRTIADELLAVDAIAFLSCSLLSFFALRTRNRSRRWRRTLDITSDVIFLFGLMQMIVVCLMMAWSMN